jgi:hypothetical protein
MTRAEAELQLAGEVSQFYDDPLGFVLFAYPWGEAGTRLEDATGPFEWQADFLRELGELVRARAFDGKTPVKAIRMAVGSGHGIGKSALVAWLVGWIMSTRPHCRGTITANTFTQLETKTWAEISSWMELCVTSHWFRVTGEKMYHLHFPKTWYCTPQSSREEKSEAFAGQHSAFSTSFYLFDESSAIADKIFEVAEGGLVKGEPMEFLFGNLTRNTGKLHRVTFGSERHLWNHRSIDSRTVGVNQEQIDEWIQTYGEDSDFVRVRVRGLPPKADEAQYIDSGRVHAAQEREICTIGDEPIIAGVDVSGGGSAWTVCRFRKGMDARSIPPIRITGEQTRDRQLVVTRLAAVLAETDPKKRVAMMFIDSAFGAPIVERLHALGYSSRVVEVNFGGHSPDIHFGNMRAFMWSQTKEWLLRGAIDKNDERLEIDLTGPGYHLNKQNQTVLESKQELAKRQPSPDDGDALVLTFAAPVAPRRPETEDEEDDGYGNEDL